MVGVLDSVEGGVEVEDLALAEAGAEDSVEAFADGRGTIHNMDMDNHTPPMDQDTDLDHLTQLMAGDTGILGAHMPCHDIHIPQKRIHIGILRCPTWGTGEGVNRKWLGREEVEDIDVGGVIRLNIRMLIRRLDRFHRSNILILRMLIHRQCIRPLLHRSLQKMN